jgi:uncharacterized protein YidB (DUF937 family)
MTALLGLLALAGYQNRDKLADLLKGAGNSTQPGADTLPAAVDRYTPDRRLTHRTVVDSNRRITT